MTGWTTGQCMRCGAQLRQRRDLCGNCAEKRRHSIAMTEIAEGRALLAAWDAQARRSDTRPAARWAWR